MTQYRFPPEVGDTQGSLTDPKLKTAIDYARSMVGKTPSDADLRDYLKGTLDPRKHDWCTAFLNATLKKAGVAGTPSMMASSFLAWGRHVAQKDVRAGDVVIQSEVESGRKPVLGGLGHAAIVTGPVQKGSHGQDMQWDYVPTISGNWGHKVNELDIPAQEAITEYRRALPTYRARKNILHFHTKAHVD